MCGLRNTFRHGISSEYDRNYAQHIGGMLSTLFRAKASFGRPSRRRMFDDDDNDAVFGAVGAARV